MPTKWDMQLSFIQYPDIGSEIPGKLVSEYSAEEPKSEGKGVVSASPKFYHLPVLSRACYGLTGQGRGFFSHPGQVGSHKGPCINTHIARIDFPFRAWNLPSPGHRS